MQRTSSGLSEWPPMLISPFWSSPEWCWSSEVKWLLVTIFLRPYFLIKLRYYIVTWFIVMMSFYSPHLLTTSSFFTNLFAFLTSWFISIDDGFNLNIIYINVVHWWRCHSPRHLITLYHRRAKILETRLESIF